ncbi:unnamed protein product [Orchesella dallaii]|uniref:Uncharacterized protein n=1 Tax=Orchesella dallaii TaxID=48710 RepID=A0ABP1RID6_9HEXA
MNWVIPILLSVTVYVLYTRAHPAPQTSAQLNAITASEEAELDSQERNYLAFRKIVNDRLGLSNFSRVSLIGGVANFLDEYINGPTTTTTTTTTKKPRRKRTTTTTEAAAEIPPQTQASPENADLPASIASQLNLASLLFSSMMLNGTNGTIEIRVPSSLVNSSDGVANIEQAIREALLTGMYNSTGVTTTSGGGAGNDGKVKNKTKTKPKFDPLGAVTAVTWLYKFVRSSNVVPWAWNNSLILLDTPPVHHAVKVVDCQVWYQCDNSNELGTYVGGGS